MNNTLEGINSRMTEKEKWINDMKDRMMEITATQQNIGKRMREEKEEDNLLLTSGTTLNAPTLTL